MGGKVIFIAPLFVLHVESRKKYTGGMKMNLPPMAGRAIEEAVQRRAGRVDNEDLPWGPWTRVVIPRSCVYMQ